MLKHLRVGIPVVGGKGWLGGVSHMELHVKALASLPREERPQLFLVITNDTLDGFACYRPFAALFDGLIYIGADIGAASAATDLPLIHCVDWDDLFTQIDFLFPVSFNVLPGRCAASWIHDFQHKYLPGFFSKQDIALRDELCRRIADKARLVFCSSRAVERDFWRFFPHSKAVTRVLPLKVAPEAAWYAGDPAAVQAKYCLPDRFVLCCNQFWVHKNHRLLFAAIALLRQAGQEVHLVCTGLTDDFRHPGYMEELNQYIKELGVPDLVHILGQIPRHEQIQLIRRSLFVVQPSLFEGLSLIVQECRALGKPLILSDLDVHLEHEYGIYFKRTDAHDLAAKMAALLAVSRPGPDTARETEARLQAAGLTAAYGQAFCQLVEEAIALFGKKAAPAR
ncbi:glycosyltransferase [Sporolituus thermophilus]|uniref:Glycosyltransferase involved in cell wall bisynthesis n=1 Tax=Sporolituus thermophilus DSM 23256 TaxID=1123285 RepID=A0A1G7LW03_9FIRM|nr:glycosyltransferase [Sporolituus thermophilus]SDF53697.1 Glycosyltransferase involved in cell wall bisynthesis [Sporolituus thermophilus DSM 23256]